MSASLNLPDPLEFEMEDIPAAIAQLSACQSQLACRLIMDKKQVEEDDVLLTVAEVCKILGVKKTWVYAHKKHLPFTRQVCAGKLRFSKRAMFAWIARRH